VDGDGIDDTLDAEELQWGSSWDSGWWHLDMECEQIAHEGSVESSLSPGPWWPLERAGSNPGWAAS